MENFQIFFFLRENPGHLLEDWETQENEMKWQNFSKSISIALTVDTHCIFLTAATLFVLPSFFSVSLIPTATYRFHAI